MNRKTLRDASDADLLTSFKAGRDRTAFEEIVRRHGPMVKSVVRRALTSREDAEDAFQATFLALAKAAPRIRRPNSLAAWLHQTAMRTAKSIRRTNTRWRRKRDRLMEDMQAKEIRPSYARRQQNLQSALEREELRQIIHEEIRKLPTQYSTTVILCDLEGLSRQQAARQMATPVSTVCSRLARGRKLLRSQLARRGWELPATAFVTYTRVSENVSRAAAREISDIATLFAAGKLPATATCSQPVLLAKGVLHQMMIHRIIGVVAVCVFVGTLLPLLPHVPSNLVEAASFRDDFDDGSIVDGSPVSWIPGAYSGGDRSVIDGDLVVSHSGIMSTQVEDFDDAGNVSIRTQLRILEGVGNSPSDSVRAAVFARGTDNTTYFADIRTDGELGIGKVLEDGTFPFLRRQTTGLDPLTTDILLQFDLFENQLSLTAWTDGQPKPAIPQIMVEDNMWASGPIGISSGGFTDYAIAYRWFESKPIPEPNSITLTVCSLLILLGGRRAW